jgi:hypothetical protein
MAPPDWSDAGYQNHEQSGASSLSRGESGAEADDRCMVVIEQLMFIEAC